MNAVQWISILILVAAVALSIWRHVNIGTVTLVGVLVLGQLGGVSTKDAFSLFPASLVILIIGVTMLFAHAQRSGAVASLVDGAFRLVGDRDWPIPWIGFVIGAALSTMGAFPTAPISLLLPILATLAARRRLSYPLLAIICVLGSNAAGMSPLSPAGATVRTIAAKQGVHYSPWLLYAVVMALHVVLVLGMLLLHRVMLRSPAWRRFTQVDAVGETLARFAPEPDLPQVAASDARGRDRYRLASLLSLVGFVVVVLAFQLDVGLVALAFALLLQLVFRPDESSIIKAVPWNVVLLLSGLVIYFGVMEKIGTLTAVESGLGAISSFTVLMVLLAYLTGVVSNMESSTLATLGVMVPIGLGAAGAAGGHAFPVLVALVMSASVVVMNPVHIAGALVIANAPEGRRERMFKDLLATSLCFTALVPGLVALYPLLA